LLSTRVGSPVFCTFLDVSKAFVRVNYCNLFRLLIKRDLPACIIRVLINMYIGHLIRISWADHFNALNGVKQGGVISPVLFCIYINDLLVSMSQELAVTLLAILSDYIVLISPTPLSMRKLLFRSDSYANEWDNYI